MAVTPVAAMVESSVAYLALFLTKISEKFTEKSQRSGREVGVGDACFLVIFGHLWPSGHRAMGDQ